MTAPRRVLLITVLVGSVPIVSRAVERVTVAHSDTSRYVTAAPDHLSAIMDAYPLGTGPFVEIVPIDPTTIGAPSYPPDVLVQGDLVGVTQLPQDLWFEIRLGGWGAQYGLVYLANHCGSDELCQ